MGQERVYGQDQPVLAEQRAPSVGAALIGAILGGIVGGVLWWLVTVITGWNIGLVAVIVGFTVAYGTRTLGRDQTPRAGIIAAVVGAITFVVATYFVDRTLLIDFIEQQGQIADVPLFLPLSDAITLMRDLFEPLDVLFFAIVVYEAYKLTVAERAAPAEPEPVWTRPGTPGTPPPGPSAAPPAQPAPGETPTDRGI